MLRHTAIGRLFILIPLSIIAFGARSPQAVGQAQGTTVAGCLRTGANAGEFVLVADDTQTYQIRAAEGVDVARHANHRVELTVTVEESETSTVLNATALKMVASSCEDDG